jgi:hypothetical protein
LSAWVIPPPLFFFIATSVLMTSALPAAAIGATVVTNPTAPAATHPEHAPASATSIAKDTILRAMN